MRIRLFGLLLVLFLGIPNVYSQDSKGLWGRFELDRGISLNDVSDELKEIKGKGLLTYGYAFTIGYRFNKWTIGLGGEAGAHLSPAKFAYLGVFLEGGYKPFDGSLSPLGFNLRAGLPLANHPDYRVKATSSLSISWTKRNALWNIFGADVSAGIGYIPYTADITTYIPKPNAPLYYDSDTVVNSYNLSKFNIFLRLAVTIN